MNKAVKGIIDEGSSERIRRWENLFLPKPGPTRAICSCCGKDWPCYVERQGVKDDDPQGA